MSRSPNRLVATIFGAVYLLVGLLGLFVAGTNVVGEEGALLLGVFQVNHLHNIVHLAIGAALLLAGLRSTPAAKRVNVIVGAVYLLVGIVGFFIVDTPANILALNTPDHFLHLGSAIVLLGVGLALDRDAAPRRAAV
ncbi:hypothetical protein L332_03010 [Agrococcus pavilionensis RW1]|uniref:DUF4383 domain-containing protein n=1 Tax=Agrococcus pavilionensis RW1 TaxID=1330458 RepID=U1MRX3_9MICO|nr:MULTISPECIES: DUF4383 domain-containing protein [Agrococcus]ERG63420.1 hypothetical protein L332_03010 [Agrococcus pavilionensis RW1]